MWSLVLDSRWNKEVKNINEKPWFFGLRKVEYSTQYNMGSIMSWAVVSNTVFFLFQPYLGKLSNLSNIVQMGGSTTN